MFVIAAIVKLLGSAGFGTIFGGIMGLLNRRVDLKVEEMKYQDADRQRTHALAMRDKDAVISQQEWAGRLQVAKTEGEAVVDKAAYDALSKSYDFARPPAGGKMEAFQAFVRPFISLGYFIITTLGSAAILYYAFHVYQIKLTVDQLYEIVMFVLAWIAFMAGSTIGWWFAMRPASKAPAFPTRV